MFYGLPLPVLAVLFLTGVVPVVLLTNTVLEEQMNIAIGVIESLSAGSRGT